ncbi:MULTISPECIES: sigma factor-like helix-turn-helix DNA-binding protein [unclassified Streptomyces]|uniref:RNA polymerase sigma factor n=1 Tax=unclassified Streptomyces TaxID=2593676 RepID=UPI003449AEE3
MTVSPAHLLFLGTSGRCWSCYSAVSRLAERQRDTVILRYGLQCTPGEAAAVMGVDEATVRSQLGQAHRRLARLLDASAGS